MININNDWDPLEEIVLGTAENLNNPSIDESYKHFFPQAEEENISDEILARVIEELEQDLNGFQIILEKYDVVVKRPKTFNFGNSCVSPYWESTQQHALMPRDSLFVHL